MKSVGKTPEEEEVARIREEMAAKFRNNATAIRKETPDKEAEEEQDQKKEEIHEEPKDKEGPFGVTDEVGNAAETIASSVSAPTLVPLTSSTGGHFTTNGDADRPDGMERGIGVAPTTGGAVPLEGADVTAEDVSRLQEIAMREKRTATFAASRHTSRQQAKVRGRPARMKKVAQPTSPLTVSTYAVF